MEKIRELDYRAILAESYCQDLRSAINNFVRNEIRIYRLYSPLRKAELPKNLKSHLALARKLETDGLYSGEKVIPMLLHILSYNEPVPLTEKGECPSCKEQFPENLMMGETMFCPFCGQMLEMNTDESR